MRFDFMTANRIVFGEGVIRDIAPSFPNLGAHALIVTSREGADPQSLVNLLEPLGMNPLVFPVSGEPTVESVKMGREFALTHEIDLVIAFGGGSVIDTGKAIAVLMTNPGEPTDYLEVVGLGKPLSQPGTALIAIPTTAGTGSEVTRNAVIGVPEQKVKVSLRSPYLLPKLALIDPEFTYSLPPSVTASTGMDALAQVLEPFVSRRANPLVDLYAQEGLARAGRSLLIAYREPASVAARGDMSFTSLLGGLSLANAGLGAVHGFASPIGGMFNSPHGAICARMLPAVVEVNVRALQAREPGSAAIGKYQKAATLLTGKETAGVQEMIEWLNWLCEELKIPRLSQMGIRQADFTLIAANASTASSMQTNPIRLQDEELMEILEKSL
jgi:alcohol dehydrogenase class IV